MWKHVVEVVDVDGGVAVVREVGLRDDLHLAQLGHLVLELGEDEIKAVTNVEGHVLLHTPLARTLRLRPIFVAAHVGARHKPTPLVRRISLEELREAVEQSRLDLALERDHRQRVQQRLDGVGERRALEVELDECVAVVLLVLHHLYHRLGGVAHLEDGHRLRPHWRGVGALPALGRPGARLQKGRESLGELRLLLALGRLRHWDLTARVLDEEAEGDLHEVGVVAPECRASRAAVRLVVVGVDVAIRHAREAGKGVECMHH